MKRGTAFLTFSTKKPFFGRQNKLRDRYYRETIKIENKQ